MCLLVDAFPIATVGDFDSCCGTSSQPEHRADVRDRISLKQKTLQTHVVPILAEIVVGILLEDKSDLVVVPRERWQLPRCQFLAVRVSLAFPVSVLVERGLVLVQHVRDHQFRFDTRRGYDLVQR